MIRTENKVSQSQVQKALQHLSSYPTRFCTSPHFLAASEWAYWKLSGWGYHCSFQYVPVSRRCSRNIIATQSEFRSGGPTSPPLILVLAHLDSIIGEFSSFGEAARRSQLGPGADDNASGCAGLLELARILSSSENPHSIRFILTTAEEVGGQGGKKYLDSLTSEERATLKAVLNVDQIGRRWTEEAGVLLETNSNGARLAELWEESAKSCTSLQVHKSIQPWGGDHLVFLEAGLPTILTIEADDKQLHSAEDREELIDYDLATQITKMNLAAILKLIEE